MSLNASKCCGDRGAQHQHAVIPHHQYAFAVVEQRSHAFALRGTERHAVIAAVIGDTGMEAARVLIQHQQLEILDAAERRCVRHVRVQDAACLRQATVQDRMQVPRGRVGRVGALGQGIVTRIQQQQFAGAHARKMSSGRIHQEVATVGRNRNAEMVGDRLVPVQPGPPAQGGRQVDAGLGFARRDEFHAVTPARNGFSLG
jgi:hypothetical protein